MMRTTVFNVLVVFWVSMGALGILYIANDAFKYQDTVNQEGM